MEKRNSVPIYKTGEKANAENYRGITIIDTVYKNYAETFRRILEKQLEKEQKVSYTLMGFRSSRGAVDVTNVLNLSNEKKAEYTRFLPT